MWAGLCTAWEKSGCHSYLAEWEKKREKKLIENNMDRSKKVMSTGKIFAVLDEICQGLLFNCKPCSDIDLSLSSVHKA